MDQKEKQRCYNYQNRQDLFGNIGILGTGSALPEMVLSNDDLAEIMDTSDEWIETRTGIGQRHIADEGDNRDPGGESGKRGPWRWRVSQGMRSI